MATDLKSLFAEIEADLISAASDGPVHLQAEIFRKFAALIEDEQDLEAVLNGICDLNEEPVKAAGPSPFGAPSAGKSMLPPALLKALMLGVSVAPAIMASVKFVGDKMGHDKAVQDVQRACPECFQRDPKRAMAIFDAIYTSAPNIGKNTTLVADLIRQMMAMPMVDLGTLGKVIDLGKNNKPQTGFGQQMLQHAKGPLEQLQKSSEFLSSVGKRKVAERTKTVMVPANFKSAEGHATIFNWASESAKTAGLTDAFTGSGTGQEQANNAGMMQQQEQGSSMLPLDSIVHELLMKEMELQQREEVMQQQEQQLQQALKAVQQMGSEYQATTGVDPNTGQPAAPAAPPAEAAPEAAPAEEAAPAPEAMPEAPPAEEAPAEEAPAEEAPAEAMPGEEAPPEEAPPVEGDPMAAESAPQGTPGVPGEEQPGELPTEADPSEAVPEESHDGEALAPEGDDGMTAYQEPADDVNLAAGNDGGEGEEQAAPALPPVAPDQSPEAQEQAMQGLEQAGEPMPPADESGEFPVASAQVDNGSTDGYMEGSAPMNPPIDNAAQAPGSQPEAQAVSGGEAEEAPAENSAEEGGEQPPVEGEGEASPAAEGEEGAAAVEGEPAITEEEGDEDTPPAAEPELGAEDAQGQEEAAEGTSPEGEEGEEGEEGHDMELANQLEAEGPNTAESVEGTPEDAAHDAINGAEEGSPEDAVADKELAATLNAGGEVAGAGAAPVAPPAPTPAGAGSVQPNATGGHEIVLPLRITVKIGETDPLVQQRREAVEAFNRVIRSSK